MTEAEDDVSAEDVLAEAEYDILAEAEDDISAEDIVPAEDNESA